MKKHNCLIGFNDIIVMLIGIPVFSFIIPIVFMGCRFNKEPYYSTDKFIVTFIITTILWIGNRYIMIYCRKRFPLFTEVKKRITVQTTLMVLFTIISNNLLGFYFDNYVFKSLHNRLSTDIIISTNAAALFCIIMIMAIYESIFFVHQLKHSVEEQENLKRESIKAQLDALKTQVNPHFLFNNLNTLASIIPDNSNQAVLFVQQLSKVYRHILEVKDEKTIPLKDELDVVNAYAFLLKTRFENNLHIDINILPEKITKKIVPLSLQLLIENAIKHNIASYEKPLKITIASKNGSIEVNNNLQIKNQIMESTGIGLENIKNRYKLLTDNPVVITTDETNFTVSIPLIDN
jgi:two-component system, LytTR family, sensor kinase